jgi:hypothetical protein
MHEHTKIYLSTVSNPDNSGGDGGREGLTSAGALLLGGAGMSAAGMRGRGREKIEFGYL